MPGTLRDRWSLARVPRSLHPAAWWGWSLGTAAAASQTTNPLLLVLLVAVVVAVVSLRRGDGPWASSFRLYLLLAVFLVVVRVLYRVLLGGGEGGAVLLPLPELPALWPGGLRLLGDVTSDAVLQGLQDGLRLGAVVVCVGAANALANPKRLLAAVPGALYEVGAVLVVAVTVFAQLADSVLRVRRARLLRATPAGRGVRHRHRVVRAVVVPVLTDALDRSLQLAASMDARGYGRQAGTSRGRRLVTGTLLVTSVVLLGYGAFAVLSAALPTWRWYPAEAAWAQLDPGLLVLLAGLAAAALGFRSAGRAVVRTRHRPDRMRAAEWTTLLSGLACFAVVQLVARGPEAGVLLPGVRAWPSLTPALVLAPVLALLPALLTPPPALTGAQLPRAAAGGLS
ncbi:energy-coupling factor transporter transmembrane protein EcfT [Auraticoccus sp. F435]|uniref:Energy-coupling factor transporter transmembrane protein EcfT n=1 Tax=Auraticoccus cholistanensis TaxID=2656650 RepID=A0A6A9V1D1_9ACTN|nr:CbiQ family ECF transporter T component [Auraticoccus cholistanensis]MVA76900.1 energy-coupling factor transporter transmembrane protein EcfT [Auraticoccus cholistanensis]